MKQALLSPCQGQVKNNLSRITQLVNTRARIQRKALLKPTLMYAPNHYTALSLPEHCHGGLDLTRHIVNACLALPFTG